MIRSVQAYVSLVGSAVSVRKYCFILCPGGRWKATRLKHTLFGLPIRQANLGKFLGVTIECRLFWRQAVESLGASLVPRLNVVRGISGTYWEVTRRLRFGCIGRSS